jgi:hypothetical protein
VSEEPEETDLWLCSFPRISFGQAVGSQLDSILKFLSISFVTSWIYHVRGQGTSRLGRF